MYFKQSACQLGFADIFFSGKLLGGKVKDPSECNKKISVTVACACVMCVLNCQCVISVMCPCHNELFFNVTNVAHLSCVHMLSCLVDAVSCAVIVSSKQVKILPACVPFNLTISISQILPRPKDFPGKQNLSLMPGSWCAPPLPGSPLTGHCYRDYMAVYNLAMFKNVMGSYWSTTPGQFKMLIVDSIFVCQQASGGDVSTVHFSVQAFMKCAHKGTYWCVEMCEPFIFPHVALVAALHRPS